MSWKDAKLAAFEWVEALSLGKDLKGKTFDLKELAKKLPHDGAFRDMVIRAAKRELRKRGAIVP